MDLCFTDETATTLVVMNIARIIGYENDMLRENTIIESAKNGTLNKRSCKFPDYPINVDNASAAFIDTSKTNIICGGWPFNENLSTRKCYEFDISSFSWNKTQNSMNTNRAGHAMTAIDNTVITCGGLEHHTDSTFLSSCEKFENGNWTYIKSLPTPLHSQCMVTIDSSTILSIGGSKNTSEVRNGEKITE